MTELRFSLREGLARTVELTRKLGVDVMEDLATVGAFADGPFVVALIGRPKSGRSRIGAAITSSVQPLRLMEIDVSALPRLPLWDLLLIVTPAEQALSQTEEELAKRMRRQRYSVAVVVTRTDLLGTPDTHMALQDEVERFRLAPALGSVGVKWFFSSASGALDSLSSFVAQQLGSEPESAHKRPLFGALSDILDAAVGQLAERVAVRDREFSVLSEVEAQFSLAFAHFEEVVKLARLSVRDTLRAEEEKLFETAFGVASSAVAWVSRGGLGAWSDVEQPLRAAWDTLLIVTTRTIEAERLRFQEEISRIVAKVGVARMTVGLPGDISLPLGHSWSTKEFDEALASIEGVDLNPLFEALYKESQDALTCQEEEVGKHESVVTRIGSSFKQFAATPLDERLRTRTIADLEAIVKARLERLSEAASTAVASSARTDATVATTAIKEQVLALRASLDERHAWGTAFSELLELRSWASSGSRAYGV